MKYINTKTAAISEPHFAALVFSSIHIPGDGRSQTNPGHGYPAENKPIIQYIAFDSREEMEKWVTREESRKHGKDDYQIIEVQPMQVEIKATVSVKHP